MMARDEIGGAASRHSCVADVALGFLDERQGSPGRLRLRVHPDFFPRDALSGGKGIEELKRGDDAVLRLVGRRGLCQFGSVLAEGSAKVARPEQRGSKGMA